VARLGITASRRIGNSVARSRAKRLVREAFRATSELFPPELDLVVIVRRPLGDLKLPAVVEEWRAAASAIRRRSAALLAEPPAAAKAPP
jgi:ribonuclease P protein component